jgi:hypothetical protein
MRDKAESATGRSASGTAGRRRLRLETAEPGREALPICLPRSGCMVRGCAPLIGKLARARRVAPLRRLPMIVVRGTLHEHIQASHACAMDTTSTDTALLRDTQSASFVSEITDICACLPLYVPRA